MTLSLNAWGHAATAEVEKVVIDKFKAFIEDIEQHFDAGTSGTSVSSTNHGSGSVTHVAAAAEANVPTETPQSDGPPDAGGTADGTNQ